MIMPPRMPRHRSRATRSLRRSPPCLEQLEARTLLSTLNVLNLNDSGGGSLRQAILNAGSGDTINFAVSGQITLTSGPLQISQDLTIAGPGANNLTISGNFSSRVFNIGDVGVTISGVTIANAFTTSSGAGILMNADPTKSLLLRNCVFANNQSLSGNGGALEITGDGHTIVDNCYFVNNSSAGNGGAIDSPGIILTVDSSTFFLNAAGNGGAISIGNDPVSITNSTFYANSATGDAGAIFSDFNANYTLLNCTVAKNTAFNGGGLNRLAGSSTITLENTIVAGNTASTGPDILGSIISQGNNLIGATDGSSGFVASDQTGTAAKPLLANLGAFGNYGGPTPTLPLLQGSPALGKGNSAAAPIVDQRGDPRSGATDIGAVQLLDAIVTNTSDLVDILGILVPVPGSLRQAILDTDAHPGNDFITFAIPGGGVQTIQPLSQLPDITGTVTIDGYSQPGSSPNTLAAADNAVIDVVIDGQNKFMNGLVINNASNCVIDGLSIIGMGGSGTDEAGVVITGGSATGNQITGDFIGLQPNGQASTIINGDGVNVVNGASGNTIGGVTPAARDILSGNANWGFILEGNGNAVEGDLIGLGTDGLTAVGNGNGGVIDEGGSNNVIGGTTAAARNYIAGNVNRGLKLTVDHTSDANLAGPAPSGNVIEGDWIGLNINGVSVGSQNVAGVEIRNANGTSVGVPGAGNVISGNAGDGVDVLGVNALANSISGNLIGTDPTGTTAVGNAGEGVLVDGGAFATLIGGLNAGDGNVISGNGSNGVLLGSGAGHMAIEGNLIGLNAAGTAALGNGIHGIQDLSGALLTIGGDTPAARNVISGNHNHGIALNGSSAHIFGNYIGTDITGMVAIGNGRSGIGLNAASVNTIGDTTGGGNVISGNAVSGIEFFNGSNANAVVANLIGTAADGVTPLGNGRDGIRFLGPPAASFDDGIGGFAPGMGNVIAFNPIGVAVDAGSGNTIVGNSIFGNTGLGILLAPGGNNSIPAPVLTAVGISSVSGTLAGAPNSTYRIELFTSPANSTPGQGKTFIGSVTVQTDASGTGIFNTTTAPIAPGLLVSATATALVDPFAGDTSEFSNYIAAPLPLARFLVTASSPTATAGQFDSFTVTAVDGNGVVLNNYQGTVVFTSVGTDGAPSLPAQFTFTAADNGSHIFSATYFVAGEQTLTATDLLNGAFGSASVLVGAASFDHLTLTGLSAATPIGVQNVVTVEAVDKFGNIVSSFSNNEILQLSSNDPLLQRPNGNGLVTLVNGVGTFDVTFRSLVTETPSAGGNVRIYILTVNEVRNPAIFASQSIALPLYLLPSPVHFIAVENTPFTNQEVATFVSDLALPTETTLNPGDFTATIDWGDGTPLDKGSISINGSTFVVVGSHTYPTGQTDYPVDVTITFNGGFSSQPVTPSAAGVVTAEQFANLTAATVTRALKDQTTLIANTPNADATLNGASFDLNTTLFVANYAHNPVPGTSVQGVSFYDLRDTNPVTGAQLVVTFRFPAGAGVPQLMFFDPAQGKFVPVVGSTLFPPVQVAPGVLSVTVVFDATSFPQISSLTGSVFTIVLAPVQATTQTTISPALSLADRSGSGLTVTRELTFQGSGLTVGLRPSQDATAAVSRADLSGGGDDALDDADPADIDAIFKALGFGQPLDAPIVAPVAAPSPTPQITPAATGPGAALPAIEAFDAVGAALPVVEPTDAAGAALPVVEPVDAAFAELAVEPLSLRRQARLEQVSSKIPFTSAAPSLLAVPLLGALAIQPTQPSRGKRRRRIGVFGAR
jgi:predicted outer membrane repeat protein